jgi:adenosylhomocysteine nucleosidase
MAVGVVAALEAEARTLGRAVLRPDGLSALSEGALLAVSGMGSTRAAIAAARLADAGVSALLSFGLAGGLDPRLRAGTVVVPGEIISRAGVRFATSAQWRDQFRAALAGEPPTVSGVLLGSADPIDSVADKAAAFRDTGAAAVDMESLGIAEVAAARGLPFIAIRVIVDTAADALPQAVMAASRGAGISVSRLIGGLASAPRELPALLALARRYRAAMRALRAVAGSGLRAPMRAQVPIS